MIKKLSLVLMAPALVLLICCRTAQTTSPDTPVDPRTHRYITLSGSSYDMGFQHGSGLKPVIRSLVIQWKDYLRNTLLVSPDAFIHEFAARTDYKTAIQQYTPELWRELEGLAAGAEVDLETMFVFQLVDEIWCQGGSPDFHSCTTFGVNKTADHPVLTGQNLDIPFFHGYQTVLHLVPEGGPQTYVFTYPGLIGACGMNESPLSVTVNSILQLKSGRDGLPVAFIVRGILGLNSFEEAIEFISTVTHASGQNYLIGSADSAASYECSRNTVAAHLPFPGARFTYHTNHPLANFNLTDELVADLAAQGKTPEEYTFYCYRYSNLLQHFSSNSVPVDIDILKAVFASRSSYINNTSTFGCIIMEHGSDPAFHISPGRPDEIPFTVYGF
ncbi:hypothetical protein JXO52_03270 [bacterium]|nr:hypothetical protein [bacterium]